MKLHGSTLQLLITMYNPQQFQEVMNDMRIAFEIAIADGVKPYMCLDFTDGDDIAILDDIPDPPETYMWN